MKDFCKYCHKEIKKSDPKGFLKHLIDKHPEKLERSDITLASLFGLKLPDLASSNQRSN